MKNHSMRQSDYLNLGQSGENATGTEREREAVKKTKSGKSNLVPDPGKDETKRPSGKNRQTRGESVKDR